MSGLAATGRGGQPPIPSGSQGAHGMVDRDDLLAMVDQAIAHRVTLTSDPSGSRNAWLLRARAEPSRSAGASRWRSYRATSGDPQQFLLAVLRATRQPLGTVGELRADGAAPAFDGQAVIDRILSR